MDIEVSWKTERGAFRLTSGDGDWLLEAPGAQVRLDDASLAALQRALRKVVARQRAPRAGTPWTPDEDDLLRGRFADGLEPPELAAAHERSRGAILARLATLGLIDASEGGRFRTAEPLTSE